MRKLYFIIFLSFISIIKSIAVEINPLTKYGYGQEWQSNKKFIYTKPGLSEFYFSKTEIEMAWIINLARKDPKLFIKNVISREVAAFKYPPRLRNIIKKEYASTFNYLLLSKVHKFIAKYQNDSIMLNSINQLEKIRRVDSVLLSPSLLKGSFIIDKNNPVKYILFALSQNGPIGDAFEKIIFSEINFIGFHINPIAQSNKVKVLYSADSLDTSWEFKTDFSEFDLSNWSQSNVYTWKDQKDPLLNYYINNDKDIGYSINDEWYTFKMIRRGTYVEPNKFKLIEDSLSKESISYNKGSITLLSVVKPLPDNSRMDTVIDAKGRNSSSLGLRSIGADENLDLYTYYRIQNPKSPYESRVIIERITCKKDDFLPLDSIINIKDLDTTGFYRIDRYAKAINSNDLPKLVLMLTNQYKTDLHKFRSIYSWITSHITYDDEGLKNRTAVWSNAYEVFEIRKTICSGFSALLNKMAEIAGLNCSKVVGMARTGINSSGLHAWNLARIDGVYDSNKIKGKYFLIDPTWGIFCPNPNEFAKHHYSQLKAESLVQQRPWLDEWLK